MRCLTLATVMLSWTAIAAAQDVRGQFEGTVRSATSGEALKGAAITLLSKNGKQGISARTTTDLHGAFALSGLEPGQYQVAVGKVGYQTLHVTTPVVIGRDGGGAASLAVSLWPHGTIRGQVMDLEGEAVADAEVRAYAILYEPGGMTLSPASSGSTDELGKYTLGNLPPGKYLLQVSPPRKPRAAGKSYVDAPVAYYPGSPVPSQAVPIELSSGADFASADVRIPADPTYRIAGSVWDDTAEAPCGSCAIRVIQNDGAYRVSSPHIARVSSDGAFVLRGLPSGDYSLVASRGTHALAQTQVSIRDWHIEDVRLTLGTRYSVSGEIVLENPPNGIDVTAWTLRLSPVNLPAAWPVEETEVTEDRRFEMSEVPPARYQFELQGLPPGAYLKTVLGAQLQPNSEIVVSSDTAFVTLQPVVGFSAASLSGKVRASGNQSTIHARVYVVPGANQTSPQLPVSTVTNSDGTFGIPSLAPGSYTLYAFPASSSLQIFDPVLQASLSGYAKNVDLAPKEMLSVEVDLAPQLR